MMCRKLTDLPVEPAPQLPHESREAAVKAVDIGMNNIDYDTKSMAYVSEGMRGKEPERRGCQFQKYRVQRRLQYMIWRGADGGKKK